MTLYGAIYFKDGKVVIEPKLFQDLQDLSTYIIEAELPDNTETMEYECECKREFCPLG